LLAAHIKDTLGLVAVGAARTIPIAWSIPAFGGPCLSRRLRLGMGIGLSLLCLPVLAGSLPPGGAVLLGLLVAREVVVGVVMGFVCACLFRAAEAAGQFTDVLRGANLAEVISPAGGARSSPLGALMLLLSVVVFFEIGGLGYLTSALVRSYEAVPLDVGVPMHFAGNLHAMAMVAIAASAKLIEAAIGLCAPAIVALLLADILLGIVGRALPQIPLDFVGMPLKALLGVGAVLLGLGGLDMALQGGFRGFFDLLGLAFRIRP
jgi:type III secretory pathway component EscT